MTTVAEALTPMIARMLGERLPIRIRFWDGSALGEEGSRTAIEVRRPDALRRLLFAPNELGLGSAYVAGDIDVDGDIFEALALRKSIAAPSEHADLGFGWKAWLDLIGAGRAFGILGFPPSPPPEEAHLRGRLHSRRRDAAAIAHHYDVSNDFYRLVLGPTMTYSCAYFPTPDTALDDAQTAKYELICRKLGLRPGMRLLDVGCGWGGMAMHAAAHHEVHAVGVTISRQQAELGAKRVAEAGLTDRVEIRLQDYRDVSDGPYDAISSIGMFEHVGLARLEQYFGHLYELLTPVGRLLNHAISRPWGKPGFDRKSFIARYVFPDGELHEVGTVVSAMHRQGYEVRDVESLREHYALTLRHWVNNLQSRWDDAVRFAGEARARVWRLYMAGSAINFEAGRVNVHQVLGVKQAADGSSDIPLTRAGLVV